jgi:hypothetical protein
MCGTISNTLKKIKKVICGKLWQFHLASTSKGKVIPVLNKVEQLEDVSCASLSPT